MTDLTLLPCPFCGGEADHSMGKRGDDSPWPYVECIKCGATTEPDQWNRRSPAVPEGCVVVPRAELVEAHMYWNGRINERAMQDALNNYDAQILRWLSTAPPTADQPGEGG